MRVIELGGLNRGSIPFAFPASHVAWTWKGADEPSLAFRYTSATTHSGWQDVPESHDMEHGEKHYSAVLTVPDALALEWKIDLAGPPVKALTLDYIDAGTSPPVRAADQEGALVPTIVTRAEWGADESIKRTTGDCERRFYPVQQLFVHHTAGSNFDPDPAATMRAIYWFHTIDRGWCDVGYNFVIGWDGTIYEGRWARPYGYWEDHTSEARNGYAVAGAHVANFNSGSVGISLMGDFTRIAPPPEMKRSLVQVLAWEADRHDLDPLGRHVYRNPETGDGLRLPIIAGHRDAGQTSCPGGLLYRSLPDIRRDTEANAGFGRESTAISLASPTPYVYPGDPATLTGNLAGPDGGPLVFTTISIYKRTGTGPWVDGGETTTGADGTFTISSSPVANESVVAVFPGDARMWGAQSDAVRVKVRPRVTFSPQGGTDDGSGTWHFPPGTTGVFFAGAVDPAHAGSLISIRVQQVIEDGSAVEVKRQRTETSEEGTFGYDLDVPEVGVRYRVVAWFTHDEDHAASPSAPVFLQVDA